MYRIRITEISSRKKAQIIQALKEECLTFDVTSESTFYEGVKVVDKEQYIQVSKWGLADYIASHFTKERLDVYGPYGEGLVE